VTLDAAALFDAVASHLLTLGLFDRVGRHEPENGPGNGLTATVVLDPAFLRPDPARSGLVATTARLTLRIHIMLPTTYEPADGIDVVLLDAAARVIDAYHGDFELGGQVRNVDVMGGSGAPMAADAGYLDISGQVYRVAIIPVPLVINDLWEQVP
jgi:hypothetical protein